jgi:hypothetical protein
MAKILIIDIAHDMTGMLIKAAWHYIAVNRNDGRGPHPEAPPGR